MGIFIATGLLVIVGLLVAISVKVVKGWIDYDHKEPLNLAEHDQSVKEFKRSERSRLDQ